MATMTARRCELCDTTLELEYEAGGKRVTFTAHDAAFCRAATLDRLRVMQRALAESDAHWLRVVADLADAIGRANRSTPAAERASPWLSVDQAKSLLRGGAQKIGGAQSCVIAASSSARSADPFMTQLCAQGPASGRNPANPGETDDLGT